jgi:hypothetical protein
MLFYSMMQKMEIKDHYAFEDPWEENDQMEVAIGRRCKKEVYSAAYALAEVVVAAAEELEAEVVVTAALVVVGTLVVVLVLTLVLLALVLVADEVGLDDEELVLELLSLDVDLVVTVLTVVCEEEMDDVVPRWIEPDGEADVVGLFLPVVVVG